MTVGFDLALNHCQNKSVWRHSFETVDFDRRHHQTDVAPFQNPIVDHFEISMALTGTIIDPFVYRVLKPSSIDDERLAGAMIVRGELPVIPAGAVYGYRNIGRGDVRFVTIIGKVTEWPTSGKYFFDLTLPKPTPPA
jgi:hypothetical protein